jgi:hypothetical protein
VVHRDGEEQVLDAPPDDPATGVHIRSRVQPASLPALRYGRSYSFRLLGVDLAGNAVPRPSSPEPPPGPPDDAAVQAAAAHLARLREVYAARDSGGLLAAVRERVLAALPADAPDPSWLTQPAPGGVAAPAPFTGRTAAERIEAFVPAFARTGAADVDAVLAERLAQVAAATGRGTGLDTALDGTAPGGGVPVSSTGLFLSGADVQAAVRRAAVASRQLAARPGPWRVRPQLTVDPAVLAEVAGPQAEAGESPVVTAPRPYLRWEPVAPPALVARTPLGTGEQLSRLVVRTGLRDGAADAAPTSERHVVPPKGTQVEAETAGLFDDAIGSDDPAEHRRAYAWALRERGTLLDRFVPDLDEPGAVVEQPGIALHQRPGADPDALVTLDQIREVRDTPLGEGQYVVHDVDQLAVPYLPDPYAAGVALVFYDAGAPHLLPEPRVLQAAVLPFPGDWPRVQPLRLVLAPADPAAPDRLTARLDGTVIRIGLPAGEQVRVAMSSSLRRADLDAFGLWRSHLASTIDPDGDGTASRDDVVASAVLMRAAEAGWTWWLTPSVDLRLVHAVPAPVRPPQLRSLRCGPRPSGLTVAPLVGLADLHGQSTERLLVRASWEELVDDPATGGPVTVQRDDVVVNSPVAGTERLGLLTSIDFLPFGPWAPGVALAAAEVGLHRAIHAFPDTHHRRVTYTPCGATRYREFFTAGELPADEDPALAGDSVVLDIPSSARPAAPDLVDTVPLLRWAERTEPEQPFALRRVRSAGLRLWLARPWVSSGDGELLGVVLGRSGTEPDSAISMWGRDPVLALGAPTGNALAPPLQYQQLLPEPFGSAPVTGPGRPVQPAVDLPLVDLPGTPTVRVLPYEPEYHPGRDRWFVDVALEDGPALWPFIRLAVARYQPDSIAGCHLSPVGLTGWVQPLPSRTATVGRPDEDHVRVTVTGAIALLRSLPRGVDPPAPAREDLDADSPTGSTVAVDRLVALSRTVAATVQVLPDGASDLEWADVGRRRLSLVGLGDETNFRVTWSGELTLPPASARPVPLELRTPGTQPRWRVLIEEHELLDSDPVGEPNLSGAAGTTPRLVYADAVPL